MLSADQDGEHVSVKVENIGGITQTNVDISNGVTILTGKNATNRTSFLRALMTALGSNSTSLKGNSQEGHVKIKIDEATYYRTLTRDGENIIFDGEPFMDDPIVADLFAFLLESNEAREAIVHGGELRDLIMRPVDTDTIQTEINRLEQERKEIESEIDEISDLKQELPSLENQKKELTSEVESLKEELASVDEEIETRDGEVDEKREQKQELESKMTELGNVRSELEEIRSKISREEESLEALRGEQSEIETERQELPEEPSGDISSIKTKITNYRDEKQDLEASVSDLQDVIQFNEDMLNENRTEVREAMGDEHGSTDVTAALIEEEEIRCWTCGSEVPQTTISDTIDELKSVREKYMSQISDLETDIEDLQAKKENISENKRRRKEITQRLDEIEEEIEDRKSKIESYREKRTELSNEIEQIENEIEKLESDDFTDLLELHKEANELELKIEQKESKIDELTDQISRIEDRLAEKTDLEDQLSRIKSDLSDQRTKIEQIEKEAIDEFNTHMDDIIEILEYDNLSRIWIERIQTTERDGRKKVDTTKFKMHVVRRTDSGTTYEDTVDHLSESERKVTGLTFALAGYLVHDVHEKLPFMLLDSLEAIDAERISKLVEYFADYASFLVLALLPEDATMLSDEYDRVTEI